MSCGEFAAVLGPMAPAAVALVLILVSAISVWASLGTSREADVVERSAMLDMQYQRARAAVAAEAEAEAAYRWSQTEAVRSSYNRAAAELAAALDELQRLGGPGDREIARRIRRTHQEYLRADARLFAALDRKDAAGAAAIDTARIKALFGDVRASVDEAAASHRTDAAASIRELKRTSRFVSRVVPVAGAVGMLLVVFFALVMVSYRRQVRRASEREIARLEAAAFTDNLSGLDNHRSLHEVLPRLTERIEGGEPMQVAIVALDLDGLKLVNDTRGHHEGDLVIQRLAAGLRATLPEGGRAFRVGGDEFVAVLVGCTAADAFHYTQELQTHLAPPGSGVRAREGAVDPTHVTVGCADLAGADGDAELALRRADIALVEAKRLSHRGLIWSVGIEAAALAAADRGSHDHRQLLATALAKAVDAKDFLHAQPLRDRLAAVRAHRGAARHARRRDRAAAPGRTPARRGQDRRAGRDPAEARQAHRRGVRGDAGPQHAGRQHRRRGPADRGVAVGAAPPRAARRARVPASA